MARPFPSDTLLPPGKLELEKISAEFTRVLFTPPAEAVSDKLGDPISYKRPILDIDAKGKMMTIYPCRVWGTQPMQPRYYVLTRISVDLEWYVRDFPLGDVSDIENLLSMALPSVFIEDYNYGLGIRKEYRHIISMLEGLKIEHLLITAGGPTAISSEKKEAIITRSDLEKLGKGIDRITIRARKVTGKMKQDLAINMFAEFLTKQKNLDSGTDLSNKLVKLMEIPNPKKKAELAKKEQKEAINTIRRNGKKIIEEQPEELLKLRNDIELVTLEQLIKRYEEMLSRRLQETHWQKLFEENPFILNMAFGVPIVKIQGHASVGGRRISGSGDKITDFLVKNSLNNNAAIVEIKTPTTKLLSTSIYRGEIYGPSVEVTGAINQILDQIYRFQKNIAVLKDESRERNLESYSVLGILVAGKSFTDAVQQKSFELFRGNSKSIQIITFDELLEKLKQLHAFLDTSEKAWIDEQLPF